MDEDNVVEFDAAKIKKMKNLKPYRDKTDEEIIAILRARESKTPIERKTKAPDTYDKMFKQKFDELRKEFALDMNNSNDVEYLRMLVRLLIQNENLARDIDEFQKRDHMTPEDYRSLKNLGDTQTGVINAINNIQDKLGISRKQRKEKQDDDIPKFIEGLLDKAKKSFDAKTTVVSCPKCQIELMRLWFNFPHLDNKIQANLRCWRCEEEIMYAR